ncbi:MAG: hypothetical protein GY869_29025 [Planctomycetes bacterium]|nr:hypothetical protein [Planctomycetota bacterium]
MMRSGMVYNELAAGEFSVWSHLNPGIDPGQWAKLCRTIGGLSPREFTSLAALVQGHRCLKQALKQQVEGMLGLDSGVGELSKSKVGGGKKPLVSMGPSGLGGEYQEEIF